MAIVLRTTKGSALTHAELDGNFTDLQGQVNAKLDEALATTLAAATDLAEDDDMIWTDTSDADAPVIGAVPMVRRRLLTLPVGASLATTGTVNLDFSTLVGTLQTIAASGNITFTASNYAAGRNFELRIVAGASTRTLAWPATWVAYGAALPTSLASGKVLTVAIRSTGTTEGAVDATSALSV